MSVLIVPLCGGSDGPLLAALVDRLLEQGDQVRMIADAGVETGGWEGKVYIARGSAGDPDLVERAAQQVRTVAVVAGTCDPDAEVLAGLIEGLTLASSPRVVVCGTRVSREPLAVVTGSALEYVVLRVPAPGRFRRRAELSATRVAEAIDAADDLDGELRLELDLSEESSWTTLGLDAS